MSCRLLLTDGSFVLQTDGSSYLLLADPTCVDTGDGHGAGPSAWYYKKLAERKRRLREEEYKRRLALRYAERLADALAKADAEDADRLAESAQRLEQLLSDSQAYLIAQAERLVSAVQQAARLNAQETEKRRVEAKIREAAIIAARIEEELIDEEEATLLLMMV